MRPLTIRRFPIHHSPSRMWLQGGRQAKSCHSGNGRGIRKRMTFGNVNNYFDLNLYISPFGYILSLIIYIDFYACCLIDFQIRIIALKNCSHALGKYANFLCVFQKTAWGFAKLAFPCGECLALSAASASRSARLWREGSVFSLSWTARQKTEIDRLLKPTQPFAPHG